MIVTQLGAPVVAAYSSSVECMNQFRAGVFGSVGSAAAKLGYEQCLKTSPRIANPAASTSATTIMSSAIRSLSATRILATGGRDTTGVGAYVPNCESTYRPCGEIDKAEAAGKTVTSSLQAKCQAWMTACGDALNPKYQAEVDEAGQEIDPTTGLPVEPWYMNKTYWLIGGAVLVGGYLLLR